MLNTLFSAQGRLARLPYFGYTILTKVIMILALLGLVFSFTSHGGIAIGLAMIILVPVLIAMFWASINLTIKRLHDFNFSGMHTIWIYVLAFGTGAFQQSDFGILLSLVSFGVSLWLLFMPGSPEPNNFGS